MPVTRHLTILLTDIKGFTDKTSHKSRAAIQELLDEHRDIVLPVLEKGGGKLVKTIGDAFLMTFESPTDAVLAGIAVQEGLRQRNEGKAEADRIEVRIAINAGEVNLAEGDIFGEPVNITARIEGMAEAGEVTFTEAVYLAMNKNEVPSSEVGLWQLKGIPEKIRVYKVRRETPIGSGQMPPPKAPAREAGPKAVPALAEAPVPAAAGVPSGSSGPKLSRRALATAVDFFICGVLAGVFAGGDSTRANYRVSRKAKVSVSSSTVKAGGGLSIRGDDGTELRIDATGVHVKDRDGKVHVGSDGLSMREDEDENEDGVRVEHRGKSRKDKLFPFVWLLLNAATLAAWSQTPGKKLLGLRVVRAADGSALDGKTALLRSLFTLLSGAAAGLGYLWCLFEKDRRGWHDLLAGTKVVAQ
ncbi:MAG: RDD family protein [Elusimicrobia bacterium]|nr:RDD family protein [Elusimicrobiota bacterium]